LRSRFWFGWQIVNGKAIKSIPEQIKIPAAGSKTLFYHNVKEFENIEILPRLYEEEKGNW
jgi:phloretin hydrolase